MSKSNAVGRIFNDAYQKLVALGKTIVPNGNWTIWDDDVKVEPGGMLCFKNDEGFRFIVVKTRFGMVTLRDGEPGQVDNGYYVKDIPASMLVNAVISSNTPHVSTAEAAVIVGPWGKMGNNIGFLVEDIIEELKEELAK